MKTAPSLWLLRHAQPLIDTGTCYGRLDIPADALHTQQSAAAFAAVMPAHAALRHSPLQRCTQLVQALMLTPAYPSACSSYTVDPRLQEMDFGTWEGCRWDAIAPAAIDAWAQQLADTAPGDGESLAHMLDRVREALLDSWLHDSRQGTRDVVWVTHAGVVRCVQWLLHQGRHTPTAADWQLPAPAYGRWFSLPWATHTPALQGLR